MSAFLFGSFQKHSLDGEISDKVRRVFLINGCIIKFDDELINNILDRTLIVNQIDVNSYLSFQIIDHSTGDISGEYLEPEYNFEPGLSYLLADFSNVIDNLGNVVESLRKCINDLLIFEGFLLTSYGYDDHFETLEVPLDRVVDEYIARFNEDQRVPSLKILIS